jgi:predicted amidohydrolase
MHRLTIRPLLGLAVLVVLHAAIARAGEGAAPTGPTPRYVRIGHYQCIVRQGDFEANLKTLLEALRLAREARLDIVSFPEAFLTGYFGREADARARGLAIDSPEVQRVLKETAAFPLLFLVGLTELRDGKIHDTVAVVEQGKLLGCYRKAMPIYPYFTPGREFPVFEKKGLRFGVVICADGGYIEPARILALKGAQLIFAPHFNFVGDPVAHSQMVRNDHVARAVENGVYFVRGNNVVPGTRLEGSDAPGHGYGDSCVLDPNGQVAAGAGLDQEYLMIYNLDLQKKYRNRGNARSIHSARELLPQLEEAVKSGR